MSETNLSDWIGILVVGRSKHLRDDHLPPTNDRAAVVAYEKVSEIQ